MCPRMPRPCFSKADSEGGNGVDTSTLSTHIAHHWAAGLQCLRYTICRHIHRLLWPRTEERNPNDALASWHVVFKEVLATFSSPASSCISSLSSVIFSIYFRAQLAFIILHCFFGNLHFSLFILQRKLLKTVYF